MENKNPQRADPSKKDTKRESSEATPRMNQEYRSGELGDESDMSEHDTQGNRKFDQSSKEKDKQHTQAY